MRSGALCSTIIITFATNEVTSERVLENSFRRADGCRSRGPQGGNRSWPSVGRMGAERVAIRGWGDPSEISLRDEGVRKCQLSRQDAQECGRFTRYAHHYQCVSAERRNAEDTAFYRGSLAFAFCGVFDGGGRRRQGAAVAFAIFRKRASRTVRFECCRSSRKQSPWHPKRCLYVFEVSVAVREGK